MSADRSLLVGSPINFTPVADAIDAHFFCAFTDFVEHAIGTDSNPPIVGAPDQFPTAPRSWIVGELADRRDHSRPNARRESVQILLSISLEKNFIHASSPCDRSSSLRAGDNAFYPRAHA